MLFSAVIEHLPTSNGCTFCKNVNMSPRRGGLGRNSFVEVVVLKYFRSFFSGGYKCTPDRELPVANEFRTKAPKDRCFYAYMFQQLVHGVCPQHGRLRVKTTAQQEAEKAAEREKKLAKYNAGTQLLFKKVILVALYFFFF